MAHLYYSPDHAGSWDLGDILEVTGDEGRHAVKVSRLRADETILVGDGAGVIASCVVNETFGSRFTATILEVDREEPASVPITLVQALAKGDRAERAVEQSTEFGVTTVQPWQADRSVSRWNSPDKKTKGCAKWQRVAYEAAKQSLRAYIPRVTDAISTDDILKSEGSARHPVFVLDPRADQHLRDAYVLRLESPEPPHGITVVVGPEGGITEAEIVALEQRGATPVKLGSHVLRTSSAGPAAIAMIHTLNRTW